MLSTGNMPILHPQLFFSLCPQSAQHKPVEGAENVNPEDVICVGQNGKAAADMKQKEKE